MFRQSFPISIDQQESHQLILKMLRWADQFPYVQCLYPSSMEYPHGGFPFSLTIAREAVSLHENTFEQIKAHYDRLEFQAVMLSYDLKNEVEKLSSSNEERISFPNAVLFKAAIQLKKTTTHIELSSPLHNEAELTAFWTEIVNTVIEAKPDPLPKIKHNTTKKEYLENVQKIKNHILEGDIYEMNYCIELFADDVKLDPINTFGKLLKLTHTPFTCFLKLNGRYTLCLSPERFLKKEGSKIISQPIKGTSARATDPEQDQKNKVDLLNNEKERAENLMIVDLVRNDLARSAETGSVQVEELFGIYTFPRVHQMISTVTATLRPDIHPIDAIKYAFPMGSMTGAPKIKVMELIEHYEHTKRGIYSGTIGYFDEHGNFDFNVVIRSLVMEPAAKKISFQVGSAITYDSNPEQEYEECLLKANAILEILSGEP